MTTPHENHLDLVDAHRPNLFGDGNRPIRVHLHRPRPTGEPARLVLLSHGTGGSADNLAWLATALCAAGFLVAAIEHHGNTHTEPQLAPEGIYQCWDRAQDLRVALDHLITTEHVAGAAVAGFSLGGYTAAALIGARLEPTRFHALLHGHIPIEVPDFPGLFEQLSHTHSEAELADIIDAGSRDHSDPRITAAFIMAPVLGMLIDPASLHAIGRPAAIYWGDADQMAPAAENAHLYTEGIPDAHGESVGPADHEWFTDHPDGQNTRDTLARQAVTFFTTHLPRHE